MTSLVTNLTNEKIITRQYSPKRSLGITLESQLWVAYEKDFFHVAYCVLPSKNMYVSLHTAGWKITIYSDVFPVSLHGHNYVL